jgi:predicted metal-dependent HD superfamily phosphohydrolase
MKQRDRMLCAWIKAPTEQDAQSAILALAGLGVVELSDPDEAAYQQAIRDEYAAVGLDPDEEPDA